MKCLETRTRPDGIKSRRYKLEDGRCVTMLEVPATVLKAIGMKRVQEFMEKWKRGDQQRSAALQKRQRIVSMLAQGIKPSAIAAEVGCTDQRVRQIKQETQQGRKIERKRKRAKPKQREAPQPQKKIQTRWVGRNPFNI